jgi:hypothetical protein
VSFDVWTSRSSRSQPPLSSSRWRQPSWVLIQFGLEHVSRTVLARASALGAAVTAGIVLWLAIDRGSFVAGGADSSSYLSQAVLWEQGLPRVPQPLALQAPWPEADATLSPLGFCPCAKPEELVPIHPAGYPLAMAATRAAAGPGAEFWVVPVMAAGLIVCTYLLGAMVWRASIGFLASALLATSPTFLFQAFQPMSDVPAAFWWTLALLWPAGGRRIAAAAAAATPRHPAEPGMVDWCGHAALLHPQRLPSITVHRFAWLSVLVGTTVGPHYRPEPVAVRSPLNSGYGSPPTILGETCSTFLLPLVARRRRNPLFIAARLACDSRWSPAAGTWVRSGAPVYSR